MIRRRLRPSWGGVFGAAVALLAAASGPAHAQRTEIWTPGKLVHVIGNVRDVDRNDSSFRIDTGRNRITIEVSASANIQGDRNGRNDRRRYTIRDISIGNRVDVEGVVLDSSTLQARTIRLNAIDVVPTRPGRGPVVDRDNGRPRGNDWPRGNGAWGRDARTRNGLVGTVSNTTGNSSRNIKVSVLDRDVTVEVPKNTTVRRDGRGISVHELKEGDRIRITGDWRDRDHLRADVVEANSGFDDNDGRGNDGRGNDGRGNDRGDVFSGIVERLDRGDTSFRLRTSNGTFDIDARDADYNGSRRFSDLREGDVVRVYANRVRGRDVRADRVEWTRSPNGDGRPDRDDRDATVTGTLEGMDYLNRTFRLRNSVAPVTVRVPVSAEIRDERGRRIEFRDLDAGNRVQIIGARSNGNGLIIADRVEVLRD